MIKWHNDIRDVTTSLLGEVTQNVKIEPSLQPLTGEVLRGRVRAWTMQPEWM